MINNVIGHKGTVQDRVDRWNTLRIYKGSMNFYKSKGREFKEPLEMESEIYNELLTRYVH